VEVLSQGREGRYTARLLRRARLGESVFEIELERPRGFVFTAGQGVRLFAGGQGRDYSMTSAPQSATLSFCIRMIEGGSVSPVLAAAPVGTSFPLTGPHGIFVPGEGSHPMVWSATGVGIAPFLSMVRAGTTGFTLLHGVRRPGDLHYRDELEAAAARYVPCISPYRVTNWAAENLLPGRYEFFLCGNRQMIRDFLALIDERFPDSRAYTEIFF
jgi:ferredoxin-NADP reductase